MMAREEEGTNTEERSDSGTNEDNNGQSQTINVVEDSVCGCGGAGEVLGEEGIRREEQEESGVGTSNVASTTRLEGEAKDASDGDIATLLRSSGGGGGTEEGGEEGSQDTSTAASSSTHAAVAYALGAATTTDQVSSKIASASTGYEKKYRPSSSSVSVTAASSPPMAASTAAVHDDSSVKKDISATYAIMSESSSSSKGVSAPAAGAAVANTTNPTSEVATTPLAIMRAMDEKVQYRNEISPLPQPSTNSISLPGAFPCHTGHNNNRRSPAPPQRVRGTAAIDNNRERSTSSRSRGGNSSQDVGGMGHPSSPASNNNNNNNSNDHQRDEETGEAGGQQDLPIAAELVEDHENETTRLQELEAQLRLEFEQRMKEEYVRISELDRNTVVAGAAVTIDEATLNNIILDGSSGTNATGRSGGGGAATTADDPSVSVLSKQSSGHDDLLCFHQRKWKILLLVGIVVMLLLATLIGIVVGVHFVNNNENTNVDITGDTPQHHQQHPTELDQHHDGSTQQHQPNDNNIINATTPTTDSTSTTIASDHGHAGSAVIDGEELNLQQPVLKAIKERGYLRCKSESLESKKGVGFTIDLCRAIAAAIFDESVSNNNNNTNNSTRVQFLEMPFREHFGAVSRGELDISASHVSLNMGRDVREEHSGVGYTYSTPYLYTGTGLAGVPNYVRCAQEAETFENECRHLQVCVMINTVTQDIVEAHLPGSATVLVEGHADLFTNFADGTCNVIAGDTVIIYEELAREAGYQGEYSFADILLSHEHLAFLTRQDDPEWAEFVDWILRALITAEALNITQATAQSFGTTDLFGPEYENMFIRAIQEIGNYGELYERHYKGNLPRSRYNEINMGDTGLIVSDPLGTLLVDEEIMAADEMPKPIPNGTMEAVIKRGQLFCGIILEDSEGNPRRGFAEYNRTTKEWSGIDVDYCKGMAAALSTGKTKDTVFINLSDPDTRYKSLANGTVDVIAGERFSIITDVREPTTGQGFTFATPYFYYNASSTTTRTGAGYGGGGGAALALMTRSDDMQWSDLAKWVTQSTFYAEEQNITQDTASEMPIVELFGVDWKQMLRDAIKAIGNYGEIYERNLQSLPRGGRNFLNVEDTPQFYPIIPFHHHH